MTERYGGRHSPGQNSGRNPGRSDDGWTGKRRTKAGGRVNALFLVPAPLVFRAFGQEPVGLAFDLVAFGLLMAAAWMTREGVLAHEAYDARRVARRPVLPRKIIGSVLTAAGLAMAGAMSESLLTPLIFALLGGGLHLLAFGPDPMTGKSTEGIDRFQADRVARAVDEAEAHLAAMSAAVALTGDRKLENRVETFQTTARRMFRTVEADPRDLSGARRWLGVYLLGARDATVKYADLQRRDEAARAEYVALLDDLEEGFAARTEKMLLDDRSDLDVEIEVLRDRLDREGLHLNRTR